MWKKSVVLPRRFTPYVPQLPVRSVSSPVPSAASFWARLCRFASRDISVRRLRIERHIKFASCSTAGTLSAPCAQPEPAEQPPRAGRWGRRRSGRTGTVPISNTAFRPRRLHKRAVKLRPRRRWSMYMPANPRRRRKPSRSPTDVHVLSVCCEPSIWSSDELGMSDLFQVPVCDCGDQPKGGQ